MIAVPGKLRLVVGRVYRLVRLVKDRDTRFVSEAVGHNYRLLGFATDVCFLEHPDSRAVYAGVDGPDAGRWFISSLHDFDLTFRYEGAEDAAPAVPRPDCGPLKQTTGRKDIDWVREGGMTAGP